MVSWKKTPEIGRLKFRFYFHYLSDLNKYFFKKEKYLFAESPYPSPRRLTFFICPRILFTPHNCDIILKYSIYHFHLLCFSEPL